MKRLMNIIFIAVILLIMILGLVRCIWFPKDVNVYENREANQIQSLRVQTYLDGEFQNSVENSLADQVLFAEPLKKFYNNTTSALWECMTRPLINAYPDRYIRFGSLRLFQKEYITYFTTHLRDVQKEMSKNIESLNQTFAQYPELEFYAYYLETDTDFNFETDTNSGLYDYLAENIALPEDHFTHLDVEGFNDYSQWFYKTDHHWNYKGSYRAYQQIAAMLGIDEEAILKPVEEVAFDYEWLGSKALTVGTNLIYDDFTAYRFDLPEMKITINGEEQESYSSAQSYFDGEPMDSINYAMFYGYDYGEVLIDTGNDENGNVLIVGSSYDNAIVELIASHFGRTYSVDFRHYENDMGEAFHFDEYVREKEIDKVLLVGNYSFYQLDTFVLEAP